jgi:hypothetical protein
MLMTAAGTRAPIAIAEIRTDRVLEEYKKKYNDD